MEREFNNLIKAKNIKILHYLELVRIWNSLTPAMLVILGALIGGMILEQTLLLAAVFMFLYFGATTINDIFDFESDRINSPYRPLHTKKVNFTEAKLITIISFAIGIYLSTFFSIEIIAITILAVILSVFYSTGPFPLKNILLLGILNLSFLTIFVPTFAGYYSINPTLSTDFIYFLTFFTLTFVSIAFLKDLKDLWGDILIKKRTFAIRYGRKATAIVSFIGFSIFFPTSMYFFSKLINAQLFIWIFTAIMLLSVLYTITKVPKMSPYNAENAFKNTRLNMLIIIVFLVIISYISQPILFRVIPGP